MPNNRNSRPVSLLRVAFFSGLILLLLVGGLLAGIYTTVGEIASVKQERTFSRLLEEYDNRRRQVMDSELYAVQLPDLSVELDRLEKSAAGVESWLSVLKRRRALARLDSRYMHNYRETARQAALVFPYSEPLAAVEAAALIHGAAVSRQTEAELRRLSPLLASPRFIPMRLSLHVLLGDFNNPKRAAAGLRSELFPDLPAIAHNFPPPQAEVIAGDLAIMKHLAGDASGAAETIQGALAFFSPPALAGEPTLIRFAAEYFYDFGDMRHAAELFSRLPDEAALSRHADALWLAGFTGSARNIWTIVSQTGDSAQQSRVLYNLAATAQTRYAARSLLERQAGLDTEDLSRKYGVIRYSRFFQAEQALELLDAERALPAGNAATDALVELEILKRRSETVETPRVIAETWLLLDRYPQEENLYRWGAWYFDLYRSYTESALLLRNAARQNFSGQWMAAHDGLRLIREGRLDAAEEALAAIPAEGGNWAVFANLGRILEARRAPQQALENYQNAMAAGGSPQNWQKNASRIQVRAALCLRSLGKNSESRQALERAIELNPDNLNAYFELSRLE